MGCPWFKPKSNSTGKNFEHSFRNSHRYRPDPPSSHPASSHATLQSFSVEIPTRPPSSELEPLPSRPPPLRKPLILLPTKKQTRVQLYTPIYVALESHYHTQDDHLCFEESDEMALIKELNSKELQVNHLRSGLCGIVLKEFVQLDKNTPLRLAVNDRGITNRCIMQYNVPGAYLIRRSRHDSREFVLSIDQENKDRNVRQWHYLIRAERLTNYFYFPDEKELDKFFFSSFQKLIADERVKAVIPLTEILPYSIEFEEELWNIPFNELIIENKIGEGEFGEVFRAQWRQKPVAVKKIHIHGITDTITRETDAMKVLTNLYIVSFYGVSSNQISNEIFLVTELMENGDLKSWLQKLPRLPEHSTILRFSKHITYGMSYLEKSNYVHRDLACRNILVGPNANIVKIADFGLSTIVNDRDAERRQQAHSQKLPVRWSAPEVLADRATYSIKSDVWSYGILLIELWLKGGNPYDDKHPAYIESAVKDRFVHEKPPDCPDKFYELIICRCLKFEPNDRPSFERLRQLLDQWEF